MNPTMSKSMKRSTKVMGAVVISTALIAGCSSTPAPVPAATTDNQLKVVKVAPIAKNKIGDPIEQVADVISSISLDVTTKAPGDIKEIYKKRGDMVEKGEVIFRMDPVDALIQKEKAQIALAGAQQQLTKAKRDLTDGKLEAQNGIKKLESGVSEAEKGYNKLRNDYDLGLLTKFDLEKSETQLNNLKLDLDNARAKLKSLDNTDSLAQLNQLVQTSSVSMREIDRTLENLEVKATVSGVLTDLPVEVGMSVNAGFKAGQLQQLDPIRIKAELTEDSAKLIQGKPELTFYVPGTLDKTKAKVNYLADVVGSQTKSFTLELEYPNADRKLKPGSKAQILLTEEADQIVVTVPSLSVVREGGETFVFVLVGEEAQKRKVQLGRLNETIQEIRSGVKEGEQLIVSGQNQLKDKEKVQLAK